MTAFWRQTAVIRASVTAFCLQNAGTRAAQRHRATADPYLRYELDGYRENIGAGEEILIADRAWHPDLAELTEDFMLFDGDTDRASVVWYRYNDNDELLASDHSHDPADIEACRRHRDLAVAHAVPDAEFIRDVNLA